MNIPQRIVMLVATSFIGFHGLFPPSRPQGGSYYPMRRFLPHQGYYTVDVGRLLAEFTVLAAAASFLYLAAGLLPKKLTEPGKWRDLLYADLWPSRTTSESAPPAERSVS